MFAEGDFFLSREKAARGFFVVMDMAKGDWGRRGVGLARWVGAAVFLIFIGCAERQGVQAPVRRAEAVPQPPPVAEAPWGAGVVWPAGAPEIFARSAIVIDARTGRTLYQKNADEQRPAASTQKLLTALLVVREGGMEDLVEIAESDTRVVPSKLGLRPGERYPKRLLLRAMMVRSSNDAAAALARHHAGSEEGFVALMNEAAWRLGARSSYFANAHGLPATQWSTARDIARIAFYAYREPELRQAMLLRQMVFPLRSGRVVRLETTNDLLKRGPAFTGMKTGYTVAAGRCLVSSAHFGGREVIAVQLGSRTKDIFNDAERLMRWAAMR